MSKEKSPKEPPPSPLWESKVAELVKGMLPPKYRADHCRLGDHPTYGQVAAVNSVGQAVFIVYYKDAHGTWDKAAGLLVKKAWKSFLKRGG